MTNKEIARYIKANIKNGNYNTRKAAMLHSLAGIPCFYGDYVYLFGSPLIKFID